MSTIQDAINVLELKSSGTIADWDNVFSRVEKNYTMREENVLFDSIL
jgi:hypothetical protein